MTKRKIGGQRTRPSRYADRLGRLLLNPGRILPAIRRRLRSPFVPLNADAIYSATPQKQVEKTPAPRKLSRQERIAIIAKNVDLQHGLGLEIGPSHNPLLPKAEGYNVRIADHLDQAGLMEKYEYKGTARIEPVDYVIRPGRLTDSIQDRFSYIVASHVAEHTVCLISFLQDCEQLLEPGGVLTLALPDMRYCFDRFRERTGLGRVIDVYQSGQLFHTQGMVTEHFLFNAEHAGKTAWHAGMSGKYRFRYQLGAVEEKVREAAAGEYVDTHNWVFTPNQFRLLIHDLHTLGFMNLSERSFTDTIDHEFFVTLSVDSAKVVSRTELVTLSARDQLSLDESHF